jgi:transcriptional regulator GlxA family with amidase domain
MGDLPAELLPLHVGRAVVQASPDARLGDLVERLREPVEVRESRGNCARLVRLSTRSLARRFA